MAEEGDPGHRNGRFASAVAPVRDAPCAGSVSEMSVEIEILSGDASWPVAAPLFNAVWPPEVVATLPWANIAFAHADLRVLVEDETQGLVCHVGIYRRGATWKVPAVRPGRSGGLMTHERFTPLGARTGAPQPAIPT